MDEMRWGEGAAAREKNGEGARLQEALIRGVSEVLEAV